MDQFEMATLVLGALLIVGVLEFDAESGFVVQLATVALFVILFRDGIEVEAEMLQHEWRLPARKLVLAMPITCVLIALVVFSSIIVHGLSDTPGSGWLATRRGEPETSA